MCKQFLVKPQYISLKENIYKIKVTLFTVKWTLNHCKCFCCIWSRACLNGIIESFKVQSDKNLRVGLMDFDMRLLGLGEIDTLGPGRHFKNTYKLLKLRALEILMSYWYHIFQCMGKIFCVEYKGTLWNSTQNIIHIYWKMCILFRGENFKSPSI